MPAIGALEPRQLLAFDPASLSATGFLGASQAAGVRPLTGAQSESVLTAVAGGTTTDPFAAARPQGSASPQAAGATAAATEGLSAAEAARTSFLWAGPTLASSSAASDVSTSPASALMPSFGPPDFIGPRSPILPIRPTFASPADVAAHIETATAAVQAADPAASPMPPWGGTGDGGGSGGSGTGDGGPYGAGSGGSGTGGGSTGETGTGDGGPYGSGTGSGGGSGGSGTGDGGSGGGGSGGAGDGGPYGGTGGGGTGTGTGTGTGGSGDGGTGGGGTGSGGGGSTTESSGSSESSGTESDGSGGTYSWDEKMAYDNKQWDSWPIGASSWTTHSTRTRTTHDLRAGYVRDESDSWTADTSGWSHADGSNANTRHLTSSIIVNSDAAGTASTTAPDGGSSTDVYDRNVTENDTTDFTSVWTQDSKGDSTTLNNRNLDNSGTTTTSDKGTVTFGGGTSGSATFSAGGLSTVDSTLTGTDDLNWIPGGGGTGYSTSITVTSGTDLSHEDQDGSGSGADGSDRFRDGNESSDNYTVTDSRIDSASGGVASKYVSTAIKAGGKSGSTVTDDGTDSNAGPSNTNTFDATDAAKSDWSVDESGNTNYADNGDTTFGGTVNDATHDSDTTTVTGGDTGSLNDTFSTGTADSQSSTDSGSWNGSRTAATGAISSSGGLTFDFSDNDKATDSDVGDDSGDDFNQSASSFSESDVSGTSNADGSATFAVSADGTDSPSFGSHEAGGAGSSTLTETGSDHWSTSADGSDAADGSGSVTFSASDGGDDSMTASGSGSGSTAIAGGTKSDSDTINESSTQHFDDAVAGSVATDAAGNVTGNGSYSSGDAGKDEVDLSDTGSDALSDGAGDTGSDSYSLSATDKDNYAAIDAGSATLGASGVTGSDTQKVNASASDTFVGNDNAVVTSVGGNPTIGGGGPAAVMAGGGAPDDVTVSLSGSDGETHDDTVTTTTTAGGVVSSATSGTDSGSDSLNVSESDGTNTETEDDSDAYDDPAGGPVGTSAGDKASSKQSGTPPGGWESPGLAAVGGFFGNLWDRATYTPRTVWSNTSDSGYSLAGRIYVTAGTTAGSLVGVTQVSDAFSEHDAVDGHVQSTGERVAKGIGGAVQLAGAGAGGLIGAAGAAGAAGVSTRAATAGWGGIGSHAPVSPDIALQGALKWLGAGYKEIAPGVFRSVSGLRQFRMTTADLIPTHGAFGPHVHFEALNSAGAVIENLHLPVFP